MNLIIEAARFANNAHFGQRRKYTGEPYIVHPARVASRVILLPYAMEAMVAAAWLHDVVEDTHYTYKHIVNVCNTETADLVKELTFDDSTLKRNGLNRENRKMLQRLHVKASSYEAKSIKLIDRLDNLYDLLKCSDGGWFTDYDYMDLYFKESYLLANELGATDFDHDLYKELNALINSYASSRKAMWYP